MLSCRDFEEKIEKYPLVGPGFKAVSKFVKADLMQLTYRRNSYRAGRFYGLVSVIGFLGFISFLTLGLIFLSALSTSTSSTCPISTSVSTRQGYVSLYNSGTGVVTAVVNATAALLSSRLQRSSIRCADYEGDVGSVTCSSSELYSLVCLYIANASFCAALLVISALVSNSFTFFSNIQVEKVFSVDVNAISATAEDEAKDRKKEAGGNATSTAEQDKKNSKGPKLPTTQAEILTGVLSEFKGIKSRFYGWLVRCGPNVVRFFFLVTWTLLLATMLTTRAFNVCFGDTSVSHRCVGLYDTCVYNQVKNCRTYFSSSCVGTGLPLPTGFSVSGYQTACLSTDLAGKFSGRFDARVVYPSICAACWALYYDCESSSFNNIRPVSSCSDGSAFCPNYGFSTNLLQMVASKCYSGIITDLPAGIPASMTSGSAPTYSECTVPTTKSEGAAGGGSIADYGNGYSTYRDDTYFATSTTDACNLSEGNTAYSFETPECHQTGTSVNTLGFAMAFFFATCFGFCFLLGGVAKYYYPNEPWYTKKEEEGIVMKFLDLMSPG